MIVVTSSPERHASIALRIAHIAIATARLNQYGRTLHKAVYQSISITAYKTISTDSSNIRVHADIEATALFCENRRLVALVIFK
jgi:hypothetical protein